MVAQFTLDNATKVFQLVAISDDAGRNIVEARNYSRNNPQKIVKITRENYDDIYITGGRQIYFYSNKIRVIDGQKCTSKPLTNLWTDIPWNGISNEGDVKFKNGKKPEKLIKRCIEISTCPGDFVLDSFLGSGTTAAVALKMNRKWIGIEYGEHCHTHCIPRLQKVCDGTDQGGISEAVDWKGGGGFKYYYLAPSLLQQDKYGNWVINPEYNGNMLSSAMAKQEGFRFQPDEQMYWKQGKSTEKDFIYTTTQFMTVESLDRIHEEMQDGESLLICCKSFSKACEGRFININIKKIPKMLLGRCEFGKEDYSLNIINMPVDTGESEFIPKGPDKKKIIKNDSANPDLFSDYAGGDK
jgi:adenine-specific DNA-methyltransferase